MTGLGDGLAAWYGADFGEVNWLLGAAEDGLKPQQREERARAYRQVLSLFLALRQPSTYLLREPDSLASQTDRYLRALCEGGVISSRLRDAALRERISLRPGAPIPPAVDFVANKATDAVRTRLLGLLGLRETYLLDRLDLSVQTTIDRTVQQSVTHFFEQVANPQNARIAGLNGDQLLSVGDPSHVVYSFTLYEHGDGVNLLRAQTDNFNQPLSIVDGTRLQLGSTAKVRTLINYLQIVEELHRQYSGLTPSQLATTKVPAGDRLTQWALQYLSAAQNRSLEAMLEAALQRKYSGNPGEAFFTAGGVHHFANFERSEDSEIMTVSQGFQQSVNLVFIRLMRDIERYYMFRVPGASSDVLNDPNDPARRRYLERFADLEGRTFLRRFYDKYRNETTDEALQTLAAEVDLTPLRAAVIFRSVRPQAGVDEFAVFIRAQLPVSALSATDMSMLYRKYGPDKFNLNDRGYLAHVHPLELWLLNYREHHPDATLAQIFAASGGERQEVYDWLFKTRYKDAQDKRIEILLEIDAFREIHRAWKRLGYPFDSLVPSYATSIGVSGDTPRALAELAGILVNDGVRYPSVAARQLHFAERTPFDVALRRKAGFGAQIVSPVITKLVRREMIGVVENGTGRRARGGIKLADTMLSIGGKTGTGDNRFQEFGSHGSLMSSRVVNRTAAFVFFIGDRFFGTILAFVPGRYAGNYTFTSALAVQVLKDLEPCLLPVVSAGGKPMRGEYGSKQTKLNSKLNLTGDRASKINFYL